MNHMNKTIFGFAVIVILLAIFSSNAFASHTNHRGFSEDFSFSVEFVDEEDNQWEIRGEVDNHDITNLQVEIDVDEFEGDEVDDVDVDVDSDSFDASLSESDDEIKTIGSKVVVDLGRRNTAQFDLRDRIDFGIRVQDEDGESEHFDFSLTFDVDDEEFSMKVEGLEQDIIDGTVEVTIENERFDNNDRELEVRQRGDDETEIVIEDFFNTSFDRGDLKNEFNQLRDNQTGRLTRSSFSRYNSFGSGLSSGYGSFSVLSNYVPLEYSLFSGGNYAGMASDAYLYGGYPSYSTAFNYAPFFTTSNFYTLGRPSYFSNSGFQQYN